MSQQRAVLALGLWNCSTGYLTIWPTMLRARRFHQVGLTFPNGISQAPLIVLQVLTIHQFRSQILVGWRDTHWRVA